MAHISSLQSDLDSSNPAFSPPGGKCGTPAQPSLSTSEEISVPRESLANFGKVDKRSLTIVEVSKFDVELELPWFGEIVCKGSSSRASSRGTPGKVWSGMETSSVGKGCSGVEPVGKGLAGETVGKGSSGKESVETLRSGSVETEYLGISTVEVIVKGSPFSSDTVERPGNLRSEDSTRNWYSGSGKPRTERYKKFCCSKVNSLADHTPSKDRSECKGHGHRVGIGRGNAIENEWEFVWRSPREVRGCSYCLSGVFCSHRGL